MTSWYRQVLKAEVPPLIEAWGLKLNVAVSGFYVRQMKTKWGSSVLVQRKMEIWRFRVS